MIRALPKTKLWENFSQVMVHNDNIKTFDAVSKHLEMEDERERALAPLSVALVAKGGKSKGKRTFVASRPRKVSMPLKALELGKVWPRSRRLRPMETRV